MKFLGAETHSTPDMVFEVHPRLAMIMFDVECYMHRKGTEATWTSIIRPQSGDSGIHAAKRAADLRVTGVLKPGEAIELVDYLNSKYCYDPARPKLETAKVNDGGNYDGQGPSAHIHIQVADWF